MMKVVIDTNLLLSSISTRSASHWLFQAIFQGRFTLCVTTDILQEYDEIIEWGFHKRNVADSVLEALINSPYVQRVEVYYFWWRITVDPDDNKFVDCAFAAGADYLVTADGHFDVIKEYDFPTVALINLAEFRELLSI